MDHGRKQRLQKEFKKYLKTRRSLQKPTGASTPSPSTLTTNTPTLSNSHKEKEKVEEKKKRHTKQKQMSKENVPKMKRIEDEEAEEFEVVRGARPAQCLGARKSKMKWKKDEDDDEDEKKDISNPGSDVKKSEDIVKQIKKELAEGRSVMAMQIEASQTERDEMEKLLKQIKDPKWNKDKPGKATKAKKTSQMTTADLEGVTKAVAARTLEVLKTNQLLEKALTIKENNELARYFNGGASHPSEQVLKNLDKSMTAAIEKLISRPDELDDVIDNQMRQLLMNPEVAKNILLEVMFLQPKFIPISWGGRGSQQEAVKAVKPASGVASVSLTRQK